MFLPLFTSAGRGGLSVASLSLLSLLAVAFAEDPLSSACTDPVCAAVAAASEGEGGEDESLYLLQTGTKALGPGGETNHEMWDPYEIAMSESGEGARALHRVMQIVTYTYWQITPEAYLDMHGFSHYVDDKTDPSSAFHYDWDLSVNYQMLNTMVFVDDEFKRALVGFQPGCVLLNETQCRRDMCYMHDMEFFGDVTDEFIPSRSVLNCKEFGSIGRMGKSHFEEARNTAQLIKLSLPDYDIILTGHGMGAHLAFLVGAVEPNLKVLAFGTPPVSSVMKKYLGFTEDMIKALDPKRLVLIGTPWDLIIDASVVGSSWDGLMTCHFPSDADLIPEECLSFKEDETRSLETMRQCKRRGHSWTTYQSLEVRKFENNQSCVCTTDFDAATLLENA